MRESDSPGGHVKKFLVLYRSEGALSGVSVAEMFAKATPEQLQAGMAAWKAWHDSAAGAVSDLGAPLGGSTTLAGGAASSSPTAITGYSFLQAATMEDAVALLKGHPHFHMPGASVQILECLSMPGM
jgi:hypothetical protein